MRRRTLFGAGQGPRLRVRPEASRALEAMKQLADFAKVYRRGTPIPDDVWAQAQVMSEYLGLSHPSLWLWGWLNRGEGADARRRSVRPAP